MFIDTIGAVERVAGCGTDASDIKHRVVRPIGALHAAVRGRLGIMKYGLGRLFEQSISRGQGEGCKVEGSRFLRNSRKRPHCRQ